MVNIITKKPSDRRETSVVGKFGNSSTYGSDLFYGQKFQNLGLLLASGIEKSHGFFMDEPKLDHTIKRYSEVGKALGKAGYDFTPNPTSPSLVFSTTMIRARGGSISTAPWGWINIGSLIPTIGMWLISRDYRI